MIILNILIRVKMYKILGSFLVIILTGDYMEVLQIILLSVFSFIVLFIMAKISGYRQIAELSFFDYVVGITIGSIAAEMSTNIDLEWWKGILAMVIYGIFNVVLSKINQKSIKARSFIDGTPIILINKGKISKNALKKAKIEIDDLQASARINGYFNLSDIDYAIMETTGKISFMPTPLQRPLNPKDFNFSPERTGLTVNVVLDGKIIKDNLPVAGVTEQKVNQILKDKNLKIENVLLLTIDSSGSIDVFEK